jgi:hypothetical protein
MGKVISCVNQKGGVGNPLIIEKCDLEMQVGKLKLLKSSYLSQRYSLEDKTLKQYPADIKRLTELVKGYEHDIEWVKQQPQPQKDTFIGMVVEGKAYTERKAAGTAILEACKAKSIFEVITIEPLRQYPRTPCPQAELGGVGCSR